MVCFLQFIWWLILIVSAVLKQFFCCLFAHGFSPFLLPRPPLNCPLSCRDDPRFPTVRGVLRRGMTVEGLKQFIAAQVQVSFLQRDPDFFIYFFAQRVNSWEQLMWQMIKHLPSLSRFLSTVLTVAVGFWEFTELYLPLLLQSKRN